ncbi:hypothetical protein K2173_026750 [Erythroxylum novogranatense]|uniref:Cytochrome P450 n=1 Tax=Erythroxylum novogranatense TaxID=1862640 RepID=A0AAV8U0X1_9ROSI|nr:hypothetical protein K2173_026750 [Erythroxylum novogranatense]
MAFLPPYLNGVILGVVTILLFSCYLQRRFKSVKTKSAPVASGAWPLIGHLPLLSGPVLPHIRLGDLADRYGPIFTIRIGVYPTLVVSSSEIAKELFTANDAKVSSRPQLTGMKLLSYNFASFAFTPYGQFWREMRKITAAELMSNSRLEQLKHVRTSEVESSIKDLYKLWVRSKDEADQVLVEMKQWFGKINMNVIFRMIVGKRYSDANATGDNEDGQKFQKTMREFFHLSGLYVLRDAIPLLGWLDLGGLEKAMKKTAKEFDNITTKWLEEHRRRRDTGQVASEDEDFMDVLLSVIDGVDLAGYDADTVRKATAMVLLAGGTDTTTVSITWALALLLNHPFAVKKVQEELDLHVGRERLVDESDIYELVYLQAVVKESLRLYPAGPLGGPREFTSGCTVAGYHIPARTRLVVNIHKIQRDPRVWPNPNEFKPERFLSSKYKDMDVKGQHFELIPFGAGRRACPGIALSLKLTHLVLASLLQAFNVSTPSNSPLDMAGSAGLTNNIATPVEIVVTPRLPPTLYQ